MRQRNLFERWGKRAVRVLTVGVAAGALGACDKLLEVELPHLLTDEAIKGIGTAETQVNSAIALFECGYTGFGLMALGAEDAMASIAGVFSGGHVYTPTASGGGCDGGDTSIAWFDQIMGSRGMLATQPSRLVPSANGTVTSDFPAGRGVYDRIQDEWGVAAVPNGDRLSAIAAIYVAMSLTHMGEFMCEIGLDGSDLLTPTQVLTLAEDWISNRAIGHVTAAGSGLTTMPFGVTTATSGTAMEMALAIRARINWARGQLALADGDAQTILAARPRFTAWITRDAGSTRRNKIYYNATAVGFSGMLGVNNWWNGPARDDNPATGAKWPAILGFTGYKFLGVAADGRTLEPGSNMPVRYAKEARGAADAVVLCNVAPADPLAGCVVGATADNRVTHFIKQIQGPGRHEVPSRYAADTDDVPYMTWEELTLIRAEKLNMVDNTTAARTTAIGLVNGIRAARSPALPIIQGAYLATLTDGTNDQAEFRAMLLEERRREFFAEGGRYFSTKIQNTDLLWFPRRQGQTPNTSQYQMLGVVRTLFDGGEYQLNPNWEALGGLSARGTGCASLGPLPGSQVPIF
jgi:hypothetical protein